MAVQLDAAQVRRLRESAGLSAAELAAKARISERTVLNIEKGVSSYPATAQKIAKALGVEMEQIRAREVVPEAKLFRIQVVIEADKEQIKDCPRFNALVELLEKLALISNVKVAGVQIGSIIVTLEMDEVDAMQLLAMAPDFHAYARDVIWAKVEHARSLKLDYLDRLREGVYRKPDGRYYTGLSDTSLPMSGEAFYLAYLTNMLVVAEATKEIRVPLTPLPEQHIPEDGPLLAEMEIDREILLMAGYPVDDDPVSQI